MGGTLALVLGQGEQEGSPWEEVIVSDVCQDSCLSNALQRVQTGGSPLFNLSS